MHQYSYPFSFGNYFRSNQSREFFGFFSQRIPLHPEKKFNYQREDLSLSHKPNSFQDQTRNITG